MRRRRLVLSVAAVVIAIGGACGGDTEPETGSEAGALVGLFKITAGECGDKGVTSGSSFRMVQPGGAVDDGPYVINGDSPCDDKTWTPLSPGTDGGLRTGAFQPNPDPAFDGSGHGAAQAITEPRTWFAVKFALATNEVDPQTGKKSATPTLRASGGKLSGDLTALAAAWNGQHFNQGSPKPGGDKPGATSGPRGTYDESSGAYTLAWSSQIVGGPFNNFTGVWHFEGTFEPAS